VTAQISDLLAHSGGLRSIASELGVSEGDAATGAAALLPAILGGLQNQVQEQPGGLAGLGGLLGKLGGGGLLDQVLAPQPTDVSAGNGVLGEIFGSKDVSRTVAQHAAVQSGLDPSLLRKMLPLLAMLVTGYLAKQHGAASAADGGTTVAPSGGPGGLGGVLGGILAGGRPGASGGGLGSLFDQNGDGNALDDILRMAGKALR
jgi:hypothetical protein